MFAVISSSKMMYFAESKYLKELGTCQRYQQLGKQKWQTGTVNLYWIRSRK
jgi:hypothetical protein